jgi:hypothetical protein
VRAVWLCKTAQRREPVWRIVVPTMFSGVGIATALCALGLLIVVLTRRGRPQDLGSVSRTWIIENRIDTRDGG